MKIAVLASGGVDSSVVLNLLKNQGHEIKAFYLKIWLEDELQYLGSCPWEDDLLYLRQICYKLQIPLEVIPMQDIYQNEVVNYALSEIKAGRTPNSDIMCNFKVKFGKFYDIIDDSFDKVATGHYAQTQDISGPTGTITLLKKAKDTFKDQTYFLAHLGQSQLKRAIFPIGNLLKSEVRHLAETFDLPNKTRKDSQGICFLGKIKFPEFVKHHLGTKKGELIEIETNEVKGTHEGYWYYTVGQRSGIKLHGGPWYVVKKEIPTNKIYISRHYHESQQVRDHFEVTNFNWITTPPTKDQLSNLKVKVRHGENSYQAELIFTETNLAKVKIEGSDQGFAPGQFAVFYSEDSCLGCAMII